jgi:hypothetical protein
MFPPFDEMMQIFGALSIRTDGIHYVETGEARNGSWL